MKNTLPNLLDLIDIENCIITIDAMVAKVILQKRLLKKWSLLFCSKRKQEKLKYDWYE